MIYNDFSKEELYDLLRAYDIYIFKASEAGLFKTGWLPNCVTTFYGEEYLTIWKNRSDAEDADYNCWNYMYDDDAA